MQIKVKKKKKRTQGLKRQWCKLGWCSQMSTVPFHQSAPDPCRSEPTQWLTNDTPIIPQCDRNGMTTWRNDTSKLLPKHQSVYPMHSEAKRHQSVRVWSRERFTVAPHKEMDGSSPAKPQSPWELSAKPFSREGEGGASELLQTFWWQSLCSWGQVTVKEWCSYKPPPSEYYSLFWQERTQSPGRTIPSEV